MKHDFLNDPRFVGIKPFEKKVWLSTPTMHGDELKWVAEAIETNWVSTVGANINEVERLAAEKIGCRYAVALACGTAALHLATKLCGEKLYGQPKVGHGVLEGRKVFCSDMTFDATVNPVAYYTLAGRRIAQPESGRVYIVKMSDGTARKLKF